ncbi:MAG: MFS transporter [Gammaproteobacteria bacterium]|nr:MFS transporter [Gammaproteobacteria bacterium]
MPWSTVFAYGAPGVGAGYMYLLVGLYVMKFSTDVLLIAPAVMGLIFSISRVWDAISDPIVGYLSDRTASRLGRRRTWLLGSVIPIGVVFVMVFAPPEGLSSGSLVVWMGVAIIGFYSVMTVFLIPHLSLGAELTDNYHERSRLFGMRHLFFTVGSILSLVSMQLFINAESQGEAAVRETAFTLSITASMAMAALILWAVVKLRERPEFQGRVSENPFKAYADVWRNPHARLLIVVTFIENIGSAAIGVLTLYVAQYVVGAPQWAPAIILSYMIPSAFSVPMWIPLSRRFGKIRLWMFSMVLTGLSFGGMFALPFIDELGPRLGTIFVLAFFAGLAAGCGGTIGPSVQGDVIDYDEWMTGERKEGSYFAAWNFVYKSAAGVMLLLTGFVLQVAGFVPNQEQSMDAKVAMVALYGLFPLVCYVVGAWLFAHFKLDEQAYAEIRHELDARKI